MDPTETRFYKGAFQEVKNCPHGNRQKQNNEEPFISIASQIHMAARWKPPGEEYYVNYYESACCNENNDNRSRSVDNSDPEHTPKKLKRRKITKEQGLAPEVAQGLRALGIAPFIPVPFNPTPNSFNSCCNIINLFLQLTKRKKSSVTLTNSQIAKNYEDILKIAKILQFPWDFFQLTQNEMSQFLKTKQFLVLLKTKIHTFFNKMMIYQFHLRSQNPKIEIAPII